MFKKLFGQREEVPQPTRMPWQHGPDNDGIHRAIPKVIWDGPNGKMLRELGFAPDDASNVLPTHQSLDALNEQHIEAQKKLVAGVNHALAGKAVVIPYAILPWSLWNTEMAEFMSVSMKFFPTSTWNTMLLAEDDKSARALNLPVHPRAYPAGYEDAVVRLIGEARDEYKAFHQHVGIALTKGDMSMLDAWTEKQKETRASVCGGLTGYLSNAVFGEEACAHHAQLFDETLGNVVKH
jgi:hypothetical protein